MGVREDNSRLVFQEETVESMEPLVLLGFQMDRTPSWNCSISPEKPLMEENSASGIDHSWNLEESILKVGTEILGRNR